MTLSWSLKLLGLFLLVSVGPASGQFFGYHQYGLHGQGGGSCPWGSHAVADPTVGQCNSFRCVSAWFGSSPPVPCPLGALFSGREGRCVNPLDVAAQCPPTRPRSYSQYRHLLRG